MIHTRRILGIGGLWDEYYKGIEDFEKSCGFGSSFQIGHLPKKNWPVLNAKTSTDAEECIECNFFSPFLGPEMNISNTDFLSEDLLRALEDQTVMLDQLNSDENRSLSATEKFNLRRELAFSNHLIYRLVCERPHFVYFFSRYIAGDSKRYLGENVQFGVCCLGKRETRKMKDFLRIKDCPPCKTWVKGG